MDQDEQNGFNNNAIGMIEQELKERPGLKKLFDIYAEETITEKQVCDVLAPVLKDINEGKYGGKLWKRYMWLIKPIAAATAVAGLITGIALSPHRKAESRSEKSGKVVIVDEGAPLGDNVEPAAISPPIEKTDTDGAAESSDSPSGSTLVRNEN